MTSPSAGSSPPIKALAVCGPTASGKSALSISLAQALHGEVVNVDSVQVYKELNVGSAKLSAAERGGVPHHLLDVWAPNAAGNVAQFRSLALDATRDIAGRSKLPILVGGSGLYFTALLHGLAELPPTSDEVRRAVATCTPEEMYAELERCDPATAQRLNPRDVQRVSRAVEIARMTGQKPSDVVAEHTFSRIDVVSLVLVLCRPRDELYARIDSRSAQMVRDGLIPETAGILERFGSVPALETLGYKQAKALLAGELEEASLVQEISLHTRRFAKRQMTYWRNEPVKRGWIVRPGAGEEAQEVAGFDSFPARAQKRMKSFRAFAWPHDRLVEAVRARLAQPLERTEVWLILPPH